MPKLEQLDAEYWGVARRVETTSTTGGPDESSHGIAALSVNGSGRRVARNVAFNYGAFLLQVFLGLALAPSLLRGLGNERFGTLTLVGALASYVGVAELGLGTATVRAVASSGAQDDRRAVEGVLSTSLALYLLVATVGLGVLGVLAVLLPRLGVTEGVSEARVALLALGVAQTFGLVTNVYPALLFGTGRSSRLIAIGSGTTVLAGVAQIVVVLRTGSLMATALVGASFSLFSAASIAMVARASVSDVKLRLSQAQKSIARSLMASGWRNGVIGLSAAAAFNTDAAVVGAVLGTGAVAAYGVAARASGLIANLSTRISDVLVPTYAHYAALNESEKIYSLYRDTVVGGYILTLPAGALALTAGDELLRVWLGNVPDGAPLVLSLLVGATVVAVPGAGAFRLLSGMNRLTLVAVAAAISAAANLALGIWLTRRWGLEGPAVATLSLAIVYDLIVMPSYACRVLGVSRRRLAAELCWLIPPGAAALLAGLVARSFGHGNVPLLLRVLSVTLAYLIVTWFALGPERRGRYLGGSPIGGRT